MAKSAEAGQRGERIRSDCRVRVEPKGRSGLKLKVNTKVESMYGEKVRSTCMETLKALGVKHANVEVEDGGALDFVLAARIETAVKRAGLAKNRKCLAVECSGSFNGGRGRLRRSRLYLPGNSPKLFLNAALYRPDGVILDLEDSVPPPEKDAARILVRNALRAVDFGKCERMVRINQGEEGLLDLEEIAAERVEMVLIPKVETEEHVRAVDARISAIRKEAGVETTVLLMPIIESALGCFRALEIATASPNVAALTIGLEDYTADIGAQRTPEGRESLWARQVVVNAARAAGVTPIDTVFSDVADEEGLRAACLEAKGLGFEGKGCIHPRQVAVVHEAFAPSETEIERAKKIVLAFAEAEKKGLGVVALGSKMIDPPVVKRALKTVKTAEALGLLPKRWK